VNRRRAAILRPTCFDVIDRSVRVEQRPGTSNEAPALRSRRSGESDGRRSSPVGDIDVMHDFTDVRDVVSAYFALLERGTRSEVYNVCSGHDRSVPSMLERLAQLAGVDVTVQNEDNR